MVTQSVREELVKTHTESLTEALDTLLAGCTKTNDIKSDANILNVKEYTAQILSQYERVWAEVNSELVSKSSNETIKDMNFAVSINEEKYSKVQNFERAISERETKLENLRNKLNTLRATVPSEIQAGNSL
jgi:hypothetical protein